MIADRDKGYGISSAEKKKARVEIAAPPTQPGADAWQQGEIIQLEPKMITIVNELETLSILRRRVRPNGLIWE